MHQPKSVPGTSDEKLVPLFPKSWRQIGRYELVAEIARGGMGTVYLCRQTGQAGFLRLCALKLMHEHLAEDRDFVGMFLDEARIAASIHHHNVVSIVDLGQCDRGFFVVMEYIEGCTLGQLLRHSRQQRPPALVAPIIIGLLDGLHAAHTHRGDDGELMGLVHRDVSPANVLVGVDGVARITDFGIAKAHSRITNTRPGVFKGKLAYTAPELLDRRAPVDARADVFAAGAVLWRALTGRNLFLGDSDAATLHNILHRELPLPSNVGLRPPPVFDSICMRALSRDVSDRYQTAEEMARALRDVCDKQHLLGAPADVARWVIDTFRDDLDARHHAIRAAAERSRGSEARALPELPTLHATGTGSPTNSTPSSMLQFETPEAIDELELEYTLGGRGLLAELRRWPIAALCAIAFLIVAGASLALLSGPKSSAPETAQPIEVEDQAPAVTSVALPVQGIVDEQPTESEREQPAPHVPDEPTQQASDAQTAVPDDEAIAVVDEEAAEIIRQQASQPRRAPTNARPSTRDDTLIRRRAPTNARPSTRDDRLTRRRAKRSTRGKRPAPERAPVAPPPPPPRTESKPAPPPPSPKIKLERNPYLRR